MYAMPNKKKTTAKGVPNPKENVMNDMYALPQKKTDSSVTNGNVNDLYALPDKKSNKPAAEHALNAVDVNDMYAVVDKKPKRGYDAML